MKISHLIFLSFLFILLLFSITTIINYRQYNQVKANTDFLARSTTIVRESNRYQRNLLDMVSAGRGFLLTSEKQFLEAFHITAAENKVILAELNPIVKDSSQKEHLHEINRLNQEWSKEFFSKFTDSIGKLKNRDSSKADSEHKRNVSYFNDENVAFKTLLARLRKFINQEYERRETQKKILAQSIQRTRQISFSLTAVSIVIGLVVALMLARTLSKRIVKMVRMAQRISAGDYTVHVVDRKNDELSRLSASLNHMAEVLAENITLLKRQNEELDQFAHIVSHDLKAPLRGIGNVVSWIEEDHGAELPPKVHDYLQLIHGRLNRAENLIKGILSYARIETESKETELVNVRGMLTEIIEVQAIPASITVEIDPQLPTLTTQKLPLQQVFSNLLNNAIKYNDKERGKVKVYCKEHTHLFEFFVEDNGPGIAPGHQSKIFKIFQTLQDRDSFESTGIGLAIIQKILDARKERISLKSGVGLGSTFSFTWKK